MDREMDELHEEADFLDQKMTIVPAGVNGDDARLQRHNSDPDAQAMVIESLRAQVQDLFSQVTQLNNKLVNSYDRMSNIEDELHVSNTNLRTQTLKISELELERSQHLSALSTGLLVEKDHVTAELTRLMEKATDEAAQRGQAESARAEIEKDLDDLSANLFNQANMMVAEARMARARSERKAEETERALREAEEVVGALQAQMQTLHADKEQADRRVEGMRVTMGKGKWVARSLSQSTGPRLLCSHAPYQEYLALVAHLRSIRPSTQQPPAMSTLLPLPFLARLVTEDSDPTVRLDLAPSLNWLTRRSVSSAIHSGQLTVEPMSTATLLEELSPSSGMPGTAHASNIACALCGMPIFPPAHSDPHTGYGSRPPPTHPGMQNSWSTNIFKSSIVQTISTAPANLTHFRIHLPSGHNIPVRPPHAARNTNRSPTIYPLCTSNWCLTRLRSTCSLWAFVRTCVVEKVWEEGSYMPPTVSPRGSVSGKYTLTNGFADGDKPTVQPRRSRMGIGALWGTMQRSLSSTGGSRESEKDDENRPLPPRPPPRDPHRKFVPPPLHPSLSGPAAMGIPPPMSPPRTPPLDTRTAQGLSVSSEKPTLKTDDLSPPQDGKPSNTLEMPPPSALTRNESQDQFATPISGPPSFTSRPATPSTIPLPPSASASPSPEDQASAEPAGSEEAPAPAESEQEQPAAETPSTPVMAPAAVPARDATASPAPPPLPRRAAARARPQSGGGATTDEPGASKPNVIGETPAESTSDAATDGAPTPEAKPAHAVEDTQPSDGAADPTTAEEPSQPSEAQTRSAPPSVVGSTDLKEAEGSQDLGSDAALAGSPIAFSNGALISVDSLDVHAETGLYVGDATWEERTWKELVRLREEMFWARVGGVR
ncbi:hypothetical protein B0H21DRAFT_780389 [Amylocystis lapponica]|nr:hypothetical protein B0H21DRAFT_780389 [Amylocystis lapponica]